MHYYKRNIGDYHKKAGRLSMLEHGAYTLLLDACYDRERCPTLDDAIDWCWARSDEEVAAVKFVLSKFFDLVDGKYVQHRIQEEIDNFHMKSGKNKQIALNREEAKRLAQARNVHTEARNVHERAPNQEPLTINQEPINTPPTPPCRGGDACGESVDPNRVSEPTDQKPRPKPESRGTRLSSELELPDDWKIFCESERPDLLAGKLFQEFRDYWVAVPGAKGKKLDWFATWRNRVRSARSYEHGKNHHNHRTPTDNSAFGRIRAAVERERAAETVGKREAEINPKFMDIDGGSVRPPMGIELRR